MPAPPTPARPPEVDLDPEDLVAEPEQHTTSQTRRLGGSPAAASELEIKPRATIPSAPPAPPSEHAGRESKPASKPYLAGDVIAGKYKLTRIIGRGGMGAVWQAHNIPLDIDIAIKLIRRDRTAPGAGDRLLTEARAAARLMHPAIVRVFDFGETDQGDPFIVMELLHGESLNAILRRKKRLTPAVAVQTLLPVAAALASAHGKGIIHRDLKPDNIILVSEESGALVPKIVDFGIAKLLSPDVDRHVTLAGEVLGSPDYMSPEQARGADNVGEATDIWTFSVVLYELVTGKRPFDGANYNALLASIITSEPHPITAHGAGDPALSGIIEHGLAKDPGSRWPRMRDLGAALASWAVANGIEDDVMGNPIRKQWLSGAARRLLTVQPETGEAPLRSTPAEPPPPPEPSVQLQAPAPFAAAVASPVAAPPAPPPLGPGRSLRAPTIAVGARLAASIDKRRASARNAVLLIVAIVALGAAAVALFLVRDRVGAAPAAAASTATNAAPSGAASASASLSASVSASAPTVAPADDSSTAARAPASASMEPSPSAAPSATGRYIPKFPRKTRAPSAPKNIRF